MSNTSVGIMIATGAVAGVLIYTMKRRRNRSLLARARIHAEQFADNFRDRASKMGETAMHLMTKGRTGANRQKRGLLEAIDAGRSAYQRVTG
jgi:hypothetical protein